MTYRRFEELPVWNAALNLAMQVYDLAETGRLGKFAGLRNQIERAVLSISNNIAEGFERGTMAELISFLYIARGSAGEVRSMLILLERMGCGEDGDFTALRSQATDISRQLGAWITSLENSQIRGSRSLTRTERTERDTGKRRDGFLDHLRQVQTNARVKQDDPSDPKPDH